MKFSAPFQVIEFLGTRLPFAKKFEQLVVLYLKKKKREEEKTWIGRKREKEEYFNFKCQGWF